MLMYLVEIFRDYKNILGEKPTDNDKDWKKSEEYEILEEIMGKNSRKFLN